MIYSFIVNVSEARATRPDTGLVPGNVYFLYEDHIGRPTRMTSYDYYNGSDSYEHDYGTSNLYWNATYKPFGQVYDAFNSTGITVGSSPDNITWTPPFRFPGQYEDPEMDAHFDIYYNWHRFYIPGIGRYLSADPVKAESKYFYIYALNNPLINIDPNGLAHLTYCPPGGIGELCIESNVTFEGFSGKRCWTAHNITINNNMDPKVRKTPGSNAPAPSGTFPMVGEFFDYYNTRAWRIGIPREWRTGILIHGVHGNQTFNSETEGCIRVDNEAIRDLENIINKIKDCDKKHDITICDR